MKVLKSNYEPKHSSKRISFLRRIQARVQELLRNKQLKNLNISRLKGDSCILYKKQNEINKTHFFYGSALRKPSLTLSSKTNTTEQ